MAVPQLKLAMNLLQEYTKISIHARKKIQKCVVHAHNVKDKKKMAQDAFTSCAIYSLTVNR